MFRCSLSDGWTRLFRLMHAQSIVGGCGSQLFDQHFHVPTEATALIRGVNPGKTRHAVQAKMRKCASCSQPLRGGRRALRQAPRLVPEFPIPEQLFLHRLLLHRATQLQLSSLLVPTMGSKRRLWTRSCCSFLPEYCGQNWGSRQRLTNFTWPSTPFKTGALKAEGYRL